MQAQHDAPRLRREAGGAPDAPMVSTIRVWFSTPPRAARSRSPGLPGGQHRLTSASDANGLTLNICPGNCNRGAAASRSAAAHGVHSRH